MRFIIQVTALIISFGCIIATEYRSGGYRINSGGASYNAGNGVYANVGHGFGTVSRGSMSAGTTGYTNGARDPRRFGGGPIRYENRVAEVPKEYFFKYNSNDGNGNLHYRYEHRDELGNVRGTYGYRDVQGLYRTVQYNADANGFYASIRSNEPGVDDKENPANVEIIAQSPPAGIQDKYTSVGNRFRSAEGKKADSKDFVEYGGYGGYTRDSGVSGGGPGSNMVDCNLPKLKALQILADKFCKRSKE